ncbi:MAG: ABC transporter permease [Anaerolineales bacterium]|nr:ABC transporter permease [Anaerolineales bacterium]
MNAKAQKGIKSLQGEEPLRLMSQKERATRVFFRTPTAVIGTILVLAWIVVALTIPQWSMVDPIKQDIMNRLAPPSTEHWFGTDYLGRDMLSRVLNGSRISLPLSIIVATISLLTGGFIGAVAGFIGGLFDDIVMRLADITLAFPPIVLAMAIVTAAGPGLQNAMTAIVIVSWPQYARLIRSQVLSVRNKEHVIAARSLGVPEVRILSHHIIPLCISPVLVAATLDMGNVLLLASALSFIGLGALPPQPEWGLMVAEGRNKFLQWWISGFPGLAIMSLVLGFNFIGDSLRDALDPRSRSN